MKRIVSIIMILTALALAFTSCGSPEDEKPDIYSSLNKMVGENYSSLTVEITTSNSFGELNSVYVITNNEDSQNVAYTEEILATFDVVDGEYVVPNDYKEKYSGSVEISKNDEDESFTSPGGILLNDLGNPKFNFQSTYFSSVINNNESFKADVTNPSDFLGKALDAKDMTLSVSFNTDKLKSIVIEYELSSGTRETVTYTFA